jgi:dTMP kinase
MSHAALLVTVGAVVTCVLAALVFRPTGTAEERRMREERRMLRALEAQRRIRDARRARETNRRAPFYAQPAVAAAPQVDVDDRQETELRIADRERKQEEKEDAAARKAQRDAEKRTQRREEQERKATAKVERSKARAAEKQQRQDEKAALKAERPSQPQAAAIAEAEADEKPKPLAELPLFSWANRDDDDQPTRRNT